MNNFKLFYLLSAITFASFANPTHLVELDELEEPINLTQEHMAALQEAQSNSYFKAIDWLTNNKKFNLTFGQLIDFIKSDFKTANIQDIKKVFFDRMISTQKYTETHLDASVSFLTNNEYAERVTNNKHFCYIKLDQKLNIVEQIINYQMYNDLYYLKDRYSFSWEYFDAYKKVHADAINKLKENKKFIELNENLFSKADNIIVKLYGDLIIVSILDNQIKFSIVNITINGCNPEFSCYHDPIIEIY